MAFEDNKHEDDESEVNDQNSFYDDILCASEELQEDMQRLCKRNNNLKHECALLSKKNVELTNENNDLKKNSNDLYLSKSSTISRLKPKSEELTKEVCDLKMVIEKFTNGKQNFE